MNRNGSFLSLARLMYSGMRSTEPISFNIISTASLAPPCTVPHREAMPAEMQAYGLAPDEPARRTVEVEALCSWSAWRIKIRRMALASAGATSYSFPGVAKHICRKFAEYLSSFLG